MKKKKILLLCLVMLLIAAVTVACAPNTKQDAVSVPEARAAYERYLQANEIESPEANGFVYVSDMGEFAAADALGNFRSFPTQREAMQWLFDNETTPFDESLGYRLIGTQENGLFLCIPGSTLSGKKVSILGDSISTFGGVSNNTEYNSTIGDNFVYYTENRLHLEETWWQQVIDTLRLELCVNNSSSGTRIRTDRGDAPNAGYKDRCQQLHNAQGEEPDIILVYLGTNDFSADNGNLGDLESLDYEKLAAAVEAGNAEPKTVYEAYAIMLYKIQNRYPDAKIYCMTLLPRRATAAAGKDNYSKYGQPTAFNNGLRAIAEHFECTVIDLENCGISDDGAQFDYFIVDQTLHPGKYGMDLISNAVMRALLGES